VTSMARNWAMRRQRLNAVVDSLIYALSVYGVPIAVAVVTVVALFAWEPQYSASDAIPLNIRIVEQEGADLRPTEALALLGQRPMVAHYNTSLSESPFWFEFVARPSAESDAETAVELESRHATEVSCWKAVGLEPLGDATRAQATGNLSQVKGGFAVSLGRLAHDTRVLCRGKFSGPARVSALQWSADKLRSSAELFHRGAGLVEGGLVVLSAFALLTAIITRVWLYALFSAWLLASLRLAALSGGWDTQWFGRSIPPEWIYIARTLAITAYYLLTYALFTRLFSADLERADRLGLRRIVQWACLVMLVASVSLPYAKFLPVMWAAAAVGIALLVYTLTRILWVTRSKVAIWYSVSFGIVLTAGLQEVVAAALGFKALIGALNSVTAALPASLTTALAIAEQMRVEREERIKAEAALRGTYDAIPIGLFTLDAEGFFTQVNPALTSMLKVNPFAKRGERWSDFFGAEAWTRMKEILDTGVPQEAELHSADPANPRWYFVKAAAAQGKVEGSLQDITERHKATETLRYLAENDPLTGVLNRAGIERALDAAYARLADGQTFAMAYLDLDRFKLINDLFGHVAGDEVLRQVCRRAGGMLGDRHAIGRIGGDEFVIVFQDATMKIATAICRSIVDLIGRNTYNIEDKAFQVKASIGLVEVNRAMPARDAISMADRACRDAKEGHHDGLMVYASNAPAFTKRKRELRVIERVGSGRTPEGLFLLMQPIMSLRAPAESLSFEVLLRMREPDGTVLPALDVVSAAEKNGAVALVDRWVLQRTLEWLGRHREQLGKTRFASVNLSGGSLNDEKFVQDAFALFARHSYAAERLCVEITESVALHDLENTRRFIHRAREFGVKLALDDFGAGYTSFSYLKELPADAVKIDGSFVTGLNTHPANLSIIQTIVELAANLGMRSIAEWVEDRATIEALARVGVDYVQGYAIAVPQEPERILSAASAADFIKDESLARYVRELAVGDRGETPRDRLDTLGAGPRPEFH
jgi:diguanylate cyclase (GGDEF)-like protein